MMRVIKAGCQARNGDGGSGSAQVALFGNQKESERNQEVISIFTKQEQLSSFSGGDVQEQKQQHTHSPQQLRDETRHAGHLYNKNKNNSGWPCWSIAQQKKSRVKGSQSFRIVKFTTTTTQTQTHIHNRYREYKILSQLSQSDRKWENQFLRTQQTNKHTNPHSKH